MSLETNKFSFGDFLLDGEDQVLLKDGKPVALTPKAFLLLRTLVDSHGKVVDKARLMEVAWPDSFVEEGNLSFTVGMIRKALGDSRNEPLYIETVSKRGYRFIATLNEVPATPPTIINTPQPAPLVAQREAWTKKLLIPALALGSLILLIAVVWLGAKDSANVAPIMARPFSVEQLSTSGNSEAAAISPNGTFAAYSDESGGRQSLWMRNLESSENVQIVPPSQDEYLGLTFSNSGTSLFFVRKAYDVHSLPAVYRVETFGGIPVKIVDNAIRRVAVSPDDQQIAFIRCQFRKTDFCGVFLADIDGQNERKLLSTDNSVHVYDLRFSPDGASLAFSTGRFSNDQNDSVVNLVEIASGKQQEMFSERFFRIGSVQWLPDGNGILFAASQYRDGKESIWTVSRSGGKVEAVTKDAASYSMLNLDQSGSRMIAVQQLPDFRINVVDNGSSTSLGGAREIAASASGKIFYATFAGEIWSINRDGSEQRQLTNSPIAETAIVISPDERTIFFSSDEGGSRHVWKMNSDGAERKQLSRNTGGYPIAVSPDGKFVFYSAFAAGEIYKVSVDGTQEILVNEKRYATPEISPDGTLAAHLISEGMTRKVAILNIATGENTKLSDAVAKGLIGRALSWSRDGSSVYYVTSAENKNVLWRHTISTDTAQKVADLTGDSVLSVVPTEGDGFAYISGKWKFDVMLISGLD